MENKDTKSTHSSLEFYYQAGKRPFEKLPIVDREQLFYHADQPKEQEKEDIILLQTDELDIQILDDIHLPGSRQRISDVSVGVGSQCSASGSISEHHLTSEDDQVFIPNTKTTRLTKNNSATQNNVWHHTALTKKKSLSTDIFDFPRHHAAVGSPCLTTGQETWLVLRRGEALPM